MSNDNPTPILPQLELGARVGGIKELATRVTFYNGVANTLMVAGVYYQSNPVIPGTAMRLQEVLPAVTAFYATLVAFGVVAMLFEHVVMVKAQAEYNQVQQFDEGVSPIRRHLTEVQEEVRELNEKIDQLEGDNE